MGLKSLVKNVLHSCADKRYEAKLATRVIDYHTWATEREQSIKKQLQGTVSSAGETQVFFLCHSEGEIAENAKHLMAQYFAQNPQVIIAYGDEDLLDPDTGRRSDPWYKPAWSPEWLESFFFPGSLLVVRKDALPEMESRDDEAGERIQAIPEYRAYALKLLRTVAEREGGDRCIGHLPEVVFHCHSVAAREAVRLYRAEGEQTRTEQTGTEQTEAQQTGVQQEVLSVIIPSKDHPELVEHCLLGLKEACTGMAVEVLLVDNGSNPENRGEIEERLEQFRETGVFQEIKYLYDKSEFNFSNMCNQGAQNADGKQLLFLNDDVQLGSFSNLPKMRAYAAEPGVGAVGLKLYYPDSVRIQHAGITNLPMGPVHKLQFLEDTQPVYFDMNRGARNVIAVTAACLLVERERFEEAGGFSPELRVAFNDVDLCFDLYEKGYRNVCLLDAYAYHHESLSRGDDEAPQKLERLLEERRILYSRHPDLEGVDPYYSVGLNRDGLDTRIRPAYRTAGNRVQMLIGTPCVLRKGELAQYRKDACLMVRVESVLSGDRAAQNGSIRREENEKCGVLITGYGVVLGDDNACYKMSLLLCKESPEEGEESGYRIPLEPQYRPDLTENLTDQKNVALCGFAVYLAPGVAAPGKYRIGMAATSLAGGTKLRNETNRFVEITEAGTGRKRG